MTTPNELEEMAAQLWCLPQHSHKVMDAEFCKSIVEALRQVREKTILECEEVAISKNYGRRSDISC